MASSCCNSSTPVPPLGIPFNTISHFSDQMAYLPNMPWCSRQIHQRGYSSLRSPFNTIQPGQTVLPVPGPSIVPADNDPNWEDTPTTNPIANLTANRPTSSTCLQSKPQQSDNTNEQLAEVLSWLANTLNANQTPQPNTLWVDLSSKLASNGKLISNEHKKHLENNLCLYCGTGDHKLYFCPKKQTTVSPKGCSASATTDTPAAASKKPSEK